MASSPRRPRWWVPGDMDGFLGLALDNLSQILLIVALCRGLLGSPGRLVFGTSLPAVGVSLVVGNLAYARQVFRLACREGRDDRTALPCGINAVSLFASVFLVMLPVEQAVQLSWQASLLAWFGVIHGWQFSPTDTVLRLGWGAGRPWAQGYA